MLSNCVYKKLTRLAIEAATKEEKKAAKDKLKKEKAELYEIQKLKSMVEEIPSSKGGRRKTTHAKCLQTNV